MADMLDRVLADDYLTDVEALDLDDVRQRRAECQQVEVALSYVRRLVQGRIDILGAEVARRASGEGPSALADIVERLQHGELLGDHTRPPGFGRLPTLMAPDDETAASFVAEADEVTGSADLADLPELPDAELHELADRLSNYERELSEKRHRVHQRIDALQAELVRRYKSGSASVDALLKRPSA